MTEYDFSARDALIEAGFALWAKNPRASLAEVAAHAGVGRATLHRHFASRDALVKALTLRAIEESDAAAQAACDGAPSYAAAFEALFGALIPIGNRHGFLANEPLNDDAEIAAAFARMTRESHELIDAARAEGLFAPDMPTFWIAQLLDHLIYAGWQTVRDGMPPPNRRPNWRGEVLKTA